jgi:hypothetical protein
MTMVPHAFYACLLLGMMEHALASARLGKWGSLLSLALPPLAWAHAVTWLYHTPLQGVLERFHDPGRTRLLAGALLLIAASLTLGALLETRHRRGMLQHCLRWLSLVTLAVAPLFSYPVAASLYPDLAPWGPRGMALGGLVFLGGLGLVLRWGLRHSLDRLQREALRPFVLLALALFLYTPHP